MPSHPIRYAIEVNVSPSERNITLRLSPAMLTIGARLSSSKIEITVPAVEQRSCWLHTVRVILYDSPGVVRLADIVIGLETENWDRSDSRIGAVLDSFTSAFTRQLCIENGVSTLDCDNIVTCKLIGAHVRTNRSLTRDIKSDEIEGFAVGNI